MKIFRHPGLVSCQTPFRALIREWLTVKFRSCRDQASEGPPKQAPRKVREAEGANGPKQRFRRNGDERGPIPPALPAWHAVHVSRQNRQRFSEPFASANGTCGN